ncbi:uncharacterized protein C2orf73 homolog [Trichomycterus rosablanca]|uniref:uncharacterized protein C2orf73 homolog n=1 Tax=Trichomycterus rosablanca TaxID=2290929 RepID=UPI002F35CB3D
MFQGAEICLPRKKRVWESFRSNTYRIFDRNVPDRLSPDEVYKDHKYATRDPGEAELLKTHNLPQPYNVKFIRTNVRFLNEPIAHIGTESMKSEQFKWWLNTPAQDVLSKPVYCKESTQRSDYQHIAPLPVIRVRGEQNRPPATGIIPTLSPLGQPKELIEFISFNHHYDSRRPHDQPYQKSCHGAFVCSESGAMGPIAFQSKEGIQSAPKWIAHGLNSSQHALLSSQQMCMSTGNVFNQPGPDDKNSHSGNKNNGESL